MPPPWGCISGSLLFPSSAAETRFLEETGFLRCLGPGSALLALTQLPKVFQGEDAGVVAVVPGDLVSVVAHGRHRHGGKGRQFVGLEDAERIGRLLALFTAAGAGAVAAQVLPGVNAAMTVVPFDHQLVVAFLAQCQRQQSGHGDLFLTILGLPRLHYMNVRRGAGSEGHEAPCPTWEDFRSLGDFGSCYGGFALPLLPHFTKI